MRFLLLPLLLSFSLAASTLTSAQPATTTFGSPNRAALIPPGDGEKPEVRLVEVKIKDDGLPCRNGVLATQKPKATRMDDAIKGRLSSYHIRPDAPDTLIVRIKIRKSGEVIEALVSKSPADQNPRIPETVKAQICEGFKSLAPFNPATCGSKEVESYRVFAVILTPPVHDEMTTAMPEMTQVPQIRERELSLDSMDLSDGGPAVPDFQKQVDSVYAFPEVQASFPGGQDAMFKYIIDNTSYPVEAKKAKIQGTVYVNFTIGGDGRISNVKIKKGLGYGLDDECIKMVQRMPNWIPAKNNGKNVASSLTVPVKFKR